MSGRTHELKTWPHPFQAVLDGRKPFEWRRDDRGFGVGDTLVLSEWDPAWRSPVGEGQRVGYTGRKVEVEVTYILRGAFGVPEGYVVMGIRPAPVQP